LKITRKNVAIFNENPVQIGKHIGR
jgi:hypothetical protein